ncbi:DNA-binding protein [Longivirga aurantiaca]|uniref:DNA-binding protein n=1 Tax=Longivirga aurantiaca TaxID=1837743 RepID=A0ABW1SY54_9ACTN
MNRTEIEQLPPLVDLPTAARVLGIGRTLAYELVKADLWPTTVLRVGKLIRIPTAALLRLVDDSDSAGVSSAGSPPSAGATVAGPVSQ